MSTKGDKAKVRRSIAIALEVAEEDKRRKLVAMRLEIARGGVAAYRKGQAAQAVRYFHSYIKILEEIKSAGEGGLQPIQFDVTTDLPELLMISGIYWDLTKLYDRTKSPDKYLDFLHYMEKYVLFSRGMPYQNLCSETLRKYILQEKAIHKKNFREAYQSLSTSQCFVVTSLIDEIHPQTLGIFRSWRDEHLTRSPLGRKLVQIYYLLGPTLAQAIHHFPTPIRRALGRTLDQISKLVDESSYTTRSKDKLAVRKVDPKG